VSADLGALIDEEARATFDRDGVVVLRGFYDVRSQIDPIRRDIWRIIGLVIERHGLTIEQPAYTPESFDAAMMPLVAHDRRFGGEVYDAVKQIPAFVRLLADERNAAVFSALRPGAMPAIAAGGYGIRIDFPNEERFRADWHQDYVGQFRSLDGLVFWSPLVEITQALGPVQFALRSHRDGLFPLHEKNAEQPEKTGVYGLRLAGRDALVSRYARAAPLTAPGDLVVIDYQTLHASGHNVGDRPRWSMQMRYFNFEDETGKKIGWKGSFAAGVPISQIHPELLVPTAAE
jgi:ectoine hydroxylase-related dioxygenase (phytanoyl-CoA dioxygenase family)